MLYLLFDDVTQMVNRNQLIIAMMVLALGLGAPVSARMYQWVDPASGTTQLSGKPPTWYRSASGGPRVFVFENGRVVDDTAIDLGDTEREHLRQQAFLKVEQDRTAAREKLLEAKRLKATFDRQEQEAELSAGTEAPEPAPAIEPEPTADDEAPSAEQLRALIADWEKLRADNARDLIQGVPESATPPVELLPPQQ